jgi:hypothetical protein
VEVHGFNEECSAQELFQFFSGSLESVAFYPQQVPAYIAAHKDCLVYESMPNLFLLKHETSAGAIEFRLADVRVVANGSALFNRIYTDPADASKLIERIKLGRLFTASAIAA